MTDLIPVDESPGPKMHAFVIGVGRYRHLDGGDQPVPNLRTMGLGQLSSTVISARAFADWAIGEFENSEVKRGSVQLLLSPEGQIDAPRGPVVVDAAITANVRTAFDEWRRRCSLDPGNIAFFFFAGHGVARESLALLLEDFGASADAPFAGSIDFDKLHLGMARVPARLQCYWVDSCRSVPADLLPLLALDATSLITPSVRDRSPRSAPIIHATSADERAYGSPNESTQFTKALLAGLRGLGTEKRSGRWVVTPTKLFLSVASEMRRLARLELLKPEEDRLPDQYPTSGGSLRDDPKIADLKEAPEVPVSFVWEPTAAGTWGTLQLTGVVNKQKMYTSPRATGPWEQDVTAGTYVLEAMFDPPYCLARNLDPEVLALPPGYDMTIEAKPQ